MIRILYRISVLWLFSFGMGSLLFFIGGQVGLGLFFLVISLVIFLALSTQVRCPKCGARPVLWLFAIWSLLMDWAFFLSDAVLLKHCPKCKSDVFN